MMLSIVAWIVFALMLPLSVAQETNVVVRPSEAAGLRIQEIFDLSATRLNADVFVYEASEGVWAPSNVFTLVDFARGVQVLYERGVSDSYFYIGDADSAQGYKYGVANVAAFLAQVMKESLRYNACDENNWDLVGGLYPVSNACGQLGQSYQDYACPEEDRYMQCPVHADMTVTAETNAFWYGAPGPLYCGPRSLYPTTGYWDPGYQCNNPTADPPEFCTAYEGQQAGREVREAVVANRNGRTDVEGCCWWGRGAIQTTGPCNYGRLNYHLGKGAADAGRPSLYPTVDICSDPGAICSSHDFPELKWVAGLFFWINSVQTYNVDGWNFLTELHRFVDGGMVDAAFIDSVSGIVNRGCHNPPCASGSVDGGPERAANFQKVLNAMNVEPGTLQPSTPVIPPSTAPMMEPTVEIQPADAPSTSPTIFSTDPSVANGTETPTAVANETDTSSPTQPPTLRPTFETAGPTAMPEMCCELGETSQKPLEGCQSFYFCFKGEVVGGQTRTCQNGLLFDSKISACNFAEKVNCVVPSCREGNGTLVETGIQHEDPTTNENAASRAPPGRFTFTPLCSPVAVLILVWCGNHH